MKNKAKSSTNIDHILESYDPLQGYYESDRAICESSLYEYIKRAWHTIESSQYVDDWYIGCISEYLEAVYNCEISRLIINIPPRCSKSTITCVNFPNWAWVKNPKLNFLTGSYSESLAIRDCLKSRNQLNSRWFQNRWPEKIKISKDQNQKSHFTNQHHGIRKTFSVQGELTGHGGDIILLDDPMKAGDSNSAKIRESVVQWFSQTVVTRLNNPKTGRIVVIAQRLHTGDLFGHLLKDADYEHLCLPMRYEPKIVSYDKRKKDGEILSSRFDEASLQRLEKELKLEGGPWTVYAQLQQNPINKEGGLFKSEWFSYYDKLPDNIQYYTWSWDTAEKKGQENDFSVGTLWARTSSDFYLVGFFRDKQSFPIIKKKIKELYVINRSNDVLVEEKSSGTSIVADLQYDQDIAIPVIPIIPKGDKETRANKAAVFFEAGRVHFPKNKEWMQDVKDELLGFPNASHDDIVDSITQYIIRNTEDHAYWVSLV